MVEPAPPLTAEVAPVAEPAAEPSQPNSVEQPAATPVEIQAAPSSPVIASKEPVDA